MGIRKLVLASLPSHPCALSACHIVKETVTFATHPPAAIQLCQSHQGQHGARIDHRWLQGCVLWSSRTWWQGANPQHAVGWHQTARNDLLECNGARNSTDSTRTNAKSCAWHGITLCISMGWQTTSERAALCRKCVLVVQAEQETRAWQPGSACVWAVL